MLVEHSIELDLPNQGNRFAELIATTINVVKPRTLRDKLNRCSDRAMAKTRFADFARA